MNKIDAKLNKSLVERKIKETTAPMFRRMIREVGYGIGVTLNEKVLANTSREANQGDTNNMARAFFSKLTGFSSRMFSNPSPPERRPPKAGWGRTYAKNFGLNVIDSFKDALSFVVDKTTAICKVNIQDMERKAAHATNISYKGSRFYYSGMNYNLKRYKKAVDQTIQKVNLILSNVLATPRYWIRRYGL